MCRRHDGSSWRNSPSFFSPALTASRLLLSTIPNAAALRRRFPFLSRVARCGIFSSIFGRCLLADNALIILTDSLSEIVMLPSCDLPIWPSRSIHSAAPASNPASVRSLRPAATRCPPARTALSTSSYTSSRRFLIDGLISPCAPPPCCDILCGVAPTPPWAVAPSLSWEPTVEPFWLAAAERVVAPISVMSYTILSPFFSATISSHG